LPQEESLVNRFLSALMAASASTAMANQPVLEELVVTAEFRAIPLLQQPASTSVLTAVDIEQRAARHLEDILNLAPNVNFASGASRGRFFQIRGVGERSQFVDPQNPSIGFIVDGIDFIGLALAGTLFDVDQVEVLRGPQGTLHGANALAGLINLRTGEPGPDPELYMEGMVADYDSWSAGIVGAGPLISDKLLYRLSVYSYGSDGYIDNDYLGRDDTNERDETSIRGKLRWLAGEQSSLDITALYVDIDNGYDAFSLDNTRHTLSDQPGRDAQESTALGLKWQSEGQSKILQASLTAAGSETDYSYDEDWSYVGIAPDWEYSSFDRYSRERDSYSAEVRLLSTDASRLFAGSTNWVGGVYYLGDREDLRRRYTYLESDFRSRYDTDTLALFGQLDTDLSERLTLITGLRYEHREAEYSDNSGVEGDPEDDLWGGRLTLEYRLNDRHMVYGGVSRGYRAGGINSSILSSLEIYDDPDIVAQLSGVQDFDEEFLTNLELGFKGSFAHETLQLRAALFYMDREDQQVKGSLVIGREDGSSAFIDYISNAAEGNNYGLEMELNWLASDNLSLYANLGLLETEFDRYVAPDGSDLSGREQAHAPAYQYAVGGQFDFGQGFYLRVDLEGKDEFYFSDRHDVKSPAQDLVHARLGYTGAHWSIALWGRNLTDEDYFPRGFGSFGNDPRKEYAVEPYYQYGEPRLVGISASYSF
jgi:outer membrane receptor protein involved in Fe transport